MATGYSVNRAPSDPDALPGDGQAGTSPATRAEETPRGPLHPGSSVYRTGPGCRAANQFTCQVAGLAQNPE